MKKTFCNSTNINFKISDKHRNHPTNFFQGGPWPPLAPPGHGATVPEVENDGAEISILLFRAARFVHSKSMLAARFVHSKSMKTVKMK